MDDPDPVDPPVLSYARPATSPRAGISLLRVGGYVWLLCWAIIFMLDWVYDSFAESAVWAYPLVFLVGLVCVRYGPRLRRRP